MGEKDTWIIIRGVRSWGKIILIKRQCSSLFCGIVFLSNKYKNETLKNNFLMDTWVQYYLLLGK